MVTYIKRVHFYETDVTYNGCVRENRVFLLPLIEDPTFNLSLLFMKSPLVATILMFTLRSIFSTQEKCDVVICQNLPFWVALLNVVGSHIDCTGAHLLYTIATGTIFIVKYNDISCLAIM